MRIDSRVLPPVLAAASALVLFLLAAACNNMSYTATSPAGSMNTSSASVAGSWTGSYAANDSRCGGSVASATFTQDGAKVTGIIRTNDCGVAGSFKGQMEGNTLVGLIDTPGCVGGGVTGTVQGGQLHLSLGDMTKPLITGDQIIMTGGAVSLHR
jgi:hypothetical protein